MKALFCFLGFLVTSVRLLFGDIAPPSFANPYALHLFLSDGKLYSAVGTGVIVWDVSSPTKPQRIGFIPAFLACDVRAKGNFLFVASLYNGLKIFKFEIHDGIPSISEIRTLKRNARRIEIQGNILFLLSGEKLPDDIWGGGNANIDVIDIADPASPRHLGSAQLEGMVYGIAIAGNKCFIANDKNGVAIVDVSSPSSPRVVGKVEVPPAYESVPNAYNCELNSKEQLFITQGNPPLLWVDITKGDTLKATACPGEIGGYAIKFSPKNENIAVLTGYKGGLAILDLSNPQKPRLLAKSEFPGNANDVVINGDTAYVANGAYGIRVFDISEPTKPKEIGLLDIGGISYEKAQMLPIKEQPKDALWLRVKEGQIVDSKGQPYRLVAVGYPMVNFMWCEPRAGYRFGDIEGICRYLRSLGVNAIRLAFNPPPTDYRSSCVPTPAEHYPTPEEFVEKELVPLVERIESSGLYVVLDMHGAPDYSTLFGWVKRAWRAIAKRFADDPYIAWYELWQEPVFYPKEAKEAGMSSTQVRKQHIPGQRLYYMETIKDIRQFDKRHIVMVEDYGPWWWVAEEQWAPVNFRVDPGFDNALFAKRAAYDNGFSESFRGYIEGLRNKWKVPFCLAEIETAGRYNRPEDWYYFIYGWIANEKNTIPLQFWAVSDVEEMMADLWGPFVKLWASPPPPAKNLPQPRVIQRLVLKPSEAKGGEKTIVVSDGKKVSGIYIPKNSEPGSSYTFTLPRPLPVGKYRITVKLFSDGKPAFPQALVYLDQNGWQYPPDSVLGSWGEDHFYYANHHIIPLFLYTKGQVQWQTIWEPLSNIFSIQVRKVKGIPYLTEYEGEFDTRPIEEIVIEALADEEDKH